MRMALWGVSGRERKLTYFLSKVGFKYWISYALIPDYNCNTNLDFSCFYITESVWQNIIIKSEHPQFKDVPVPTRLKAHLPKWMPQWCEIGHFHLSYTLVKVGDMRLRCILPSSHAASSGRQETQPERLAISEEERGAERTHSLLYNPDVSWPGSGY